MDLRALNYVGFALNYGLQDLFYGFVSLTKAMHCGWICKPCFMDLWVLDYTLIVGLWICESHFKLCIAG